MSLMMNNNQGTPFYLASPFSPFSAFSEYIQTNITWVPRAAECPYCRPAPFYGAGFTGTIPYTTTPNCHKCLGTNRDVIPFGELFDE